MVFIILLCIGDGHMGILKNNQTMINSIKGKLSTIEQTLEDIDDVPAQRFIDWMETKAELYKAGVLETKKQPLPYAMQRGDIVMCELGINISPEFGNDGTGNHYVMIWGQQGYNFIVLPITKHCPPSSNIHTIKLGHIDGMPEEINYMKLDAIRSVSIRRLSKVYTQPDGKIDGKQFIRQISDAILYLFVVDQNENKKFQRNH